MSGRWAVGVDGGGSRARALVASASAPANARPAGSATVERSANPYAVGAEAAADAIAAAVRVAWAEAGRDAAALSAAYVTIGVAGVDRSAERTGLTAALSARGIDADRLELLADPWIALEGALPADGPDSGPRVLLVAGTGSVAVCRHGALRHRVGGWGSRVGDEGSGAWLGIEAVRATLRALDGRDEAGPLAAAVQVSWGRGADALVGRARDADAAGFAALAPAVLEHADDDEVAGALRARAVAHLAELLRTAAALSPDAPIGLALVGGVAEALADEIVAALPEALAAVVRRPVASPVAGALALALRRARAGAG